VTHKGHFGLGTQEDNPHPSGSQDFWQDLKRSPADNQESSHRQESR